MCSGVVRECYLSSMRRLWLLSAQHVRGRCKAGAGGGARTLRRGDLLQEARGVLAHGALKPQAGKEGQRLVHRAMEHQLPALRTTAHTVKCANALSCHCPFFTHCAHMLQWDISPCTRAQNTGVGAGKALCAGAHPSVRRMTSSKRLYTCTNPPGSRCCRSFGSHRQQTRGAHKNSMLHAGT